MELTKKLKEAGLTGNESRIYLELIKKGKLSANSISKNIEMDRTLAYTVLNHLIEKGYCSYIIKENKKIFKASSPKNFLNNLRKKEAVIKELITDIEKVEKVENESCEINVYEGKKAIRNMYNIFKKHKEILSFGATGRAYDYIYESPVIAKKLREKGLHGRIITSNKNKEHSFTKTKGIEVKYSDYESEATTTIFGDKIMIHIAKEKPILILIKNKDISDSYRKHFEILWTNAITIN